jgi:hypothetical protein
MFKTFQSIPFFRSSVRNRVNCGDEPSRIRSRSVPANVLVWDLESFPLQTIPEATTFGHTKAVWAVFSTCVSSDFRRYCVPDMAGLSSTNQQHKPTAIKQLETEQLSISNS